jgi:hypothetical protein
MISISQPGAAAVIQALMMKYVYFDILYTEKWMDDFLAGIGLNTEKV